jgi:hypothetical protein
MWTEELLLRDGGIPLLLGGRGSGSEGSLRRFIPDTQNQRSLLLEAARQCQEAGFHDKVESVSLFSLMRFIFVKLQPQIIIFLVV